MGKKVAVILVVLASVCLMGFLAVRFYLTQHLYIKDESDEDLIETLFDVDFPGYTSFSILESEGEGIRRIPRHILLEVEMAAVPESVVCTAEIFFDVGDPMALNSQWHRLHCVGQHFLMAVVKEAMDYGLKENDCHADAITDTLAFWVHEDVIAPGEIRSTELRERIIVLAADEDYLASIPRRDGGVFDTGDMLLHDLAGGEGGYASYVLRCDGMLDGYRTRHLSDIYEIANRKPGDHILPDTLRPGSLQFPIPTSTPWSLLEGPVVEVTVIPDESCTGWKCATSGLVVEGGEPVAGVRVTMLQTSYCSPTGGEQKTESDEQGYFAFDTYVHDTDLLTLEFVKKGYEDVTVEVRGMDCLYCSCFPIEVTLEPAP